MKKLLLPILLLTVCSLLIACGDSNSSDTIYTITFDLNEGYGELPPPQEVKHGGLLPDISEYQAPTRDDFYFSGYYDEPEDGEAYYTSSLTPIKNWDKKEDATLYAQWTDRPIVYIIFHSNDGTEDTESQSLFENSSANLRKNDFEREGYEFVGWAYSETGEVVYEDEETYTIGIDEVNLYAVWTANLYTITFNANEGEGGPTTVNAVYRQAMPAITEAPTRTGYTFTGYFDAETEGEKYYNADLTSARNWDNTSGGTLYAQWSANTYTISFSDNEGTGGQTEQVTVTFGQALPVISPSPARTGYAFTGYSNAETGGVMYYNADLIGERNWDIADDTTLYAQWAGNTYTITFDDNDGEGGPTWEVTVVYGDPMPSLDIQVPTFMGYTFAGYWYPRNPFLQGGGTMYYDSNLESAQNWDREEEDIVLYAQWEPIPMVTIIFHKNDGGNERAYQGVYENTVTMLRINTFSRTGYSFSGWSTTSTGVVEYESEASFTVGTTDVNLYAVWTVNSYTISFNQNGGEGGQTAQVTATFGQPMPAITAQAPTRTGFTFNGYWDAETGGTMYYTANLESAGNWNRAFNTTLYARWIGNSYTISFNQNGGTGGQTAQVTATYGEPMPAISSSPTREGFSFGGYWDAQTGAIYYNANLTSAKNWDKTIDTVLNAQWYIPVEMVSIPAGQFQMGSPTTEPGRNGGGDETQHQVTLTAGFYMGKYQVTQDQYLAVMTGNNNDINAGPSNFSNNPGTFNGVLEIQGRRPVERVTWYDALVFCNRLSVMENLTPAYRINNSTNPADWGNRPTNVSDPNRVIWDAVEIVPNSTGYRLPTEAQWEYACRAGTTTAFYNGNNFSATNTGYNNALIGLIAWFYANSTSITRQVGLLPANNWGLHDMHGNVWEWCWDWWANSTYGSGTPRVDPMGASSGSARVARGGGWHDSASYLRSARRDGANPLNRSWALGFRVVRP